VIRLWKMDATRWPKLPTRVPNLVPFCLIWGIDESKVGEKESSLIIGF
jgi:hypothetical protein